MTVPQPEVRRVLRAVARGDVPDLAGTPVDELLPALRHHRLAPLAAVALRRAGSDQAADALAGDLREAVSGHLRNLAALRSLAQALDGTPWAVFKGPVLSELAHPVRGVRPYADVDVLVQPASLGAAVDRLTGAGWKLMDRNHRLLLQRMPGEVHLLGPFGAQVDLHWSLLNAARARRALGLSTGPLLERATARPVERLLVPTLDDADALVHLCLHAAHSGADRLLWLVDVDQWVRAVAPAWSEVVARARASGVGPAAALVLGRARRELGAPVPRRVLRELEPSRTWTALDAVVTRVRPLAAQVSDRSAARMLARASRRTAAASVLELLKRGRAAAGGQVPSSESALSDHPDPRAWRDFLAAVARER